MKLLPLYVASVASGYGAGWWLSEWLWQPGDDAADLVVFLAFAANFVTLFGLLCASVCGRLAALHSARARVADLELEHASLVADLEPFARYERTIRPNQQAGGRS